MPASGSNHGPCVGLQPHRAPTTRLLVRAQVFVSSKGPRLWWRHGLSKVPSLSIPPNPFLTQASRAIAANRVFDGGDPLGMTKAVLYAALTYGQPRPPTTCVRFSP